MAATKPGQIDARFADFRRENPDVEKLLTRIALDLKAQGYKRIGFEYVWNRLRWYEPTEDGGPSFWLDNNFKQPYAQIVAGHEDLSGFFEFRSRRRA